MDANKLNEDLDSIATTIGEHFERHFSRTPLRQRLDDILGEAIELKRATDIRNLREEIGDLLSSTLALCFESKLNPKELIFETLTKIERRKAQYASLGRKIKVALYGGAFNMVTNGHIAAARLVLDSSKEFDEVWLMPCNQHLGGKSLADPAHRLKMCELAAKVDARIRVSDYEIVNQLSGETYQMAKLLQNEEFAKDKYDFSIVIGQDNANSMSTWPNFENLEQLIRHVVVPRIGYDIDPKELWYMKQPHIYIRPEGNVKLLETSSSEVRRLIRESAYPSNREKAKLLLDKDVWEYINDHKLYHVSEVA